MSVAGDVRLPPHDVIRTALALLSAFVLLSFLAVTPADADLWGHLTFGRDIVRTGSVPVSDSYSFTADQRWINHEWLAEATMWTAYDLGGARGLVTLKLVLACLAALAVLASWRPLGLKAVQRDALLFAAALGTWPQIQEIRPQVFSITLFAWLLFVLDRMRAGRRRWLLAVPPMFALWVNLHGGWIVGAVALLVVAGCCLVDRALSTREKAALAAVLVATAAATLCNPYGTGMVSFLADTVRPGRMDIAEWQPLVAVRVPMAVVWLAPAAALAFVLLRRARQVPAPSLLICVILAVGSLRVYRLLGFFTVAVTLLLVPYLPHRRAAAAPGSTATVRTRPFAASVATALLAFFCAVALFGSRISANADYLPEPQAASFIAANGLRGRMLMWFDYGEYAIWHLSPAIRVSMDGRRETVYSEQMRAMHARIYAGDPDAMDTVARLNPDHAWLPRSCAIVATLEKHGWRRLFDGPRSVILSRVAAPVPVRTTAPVGPRWFPGP